MQRIFYSWQSDLPSKSNRRFIGDALELAARTLGSDEYLLEAVIDRDTRDVPGSPNIVSTIFEKIGAADAFVADVSIVDAKAARPSPNPNVLIELGYALRALGESRIVLVANGYFGEVEQLPFDLRQLRCLVYECDPEASDKASVRKPFAETLRSALRSILAQPATHRLPDIRVKVTRQIMFPGVRNEAETPVVGISVENHSSAPLFLASVGLVLPPDGDTPKGLFISHDIVGRPIGGHRIEAGDRYDFLLDAKSFPTEEDGERVLCVEATDKIGRHFRSNEVEFAKVAAELDAARTAG